jgi:dTDP-4-dehydrorhamnose 3,5-epimerase
MKHCKPQLFVSPVFGDERGLFFPLSLSPQWVQSNISISQKWTFRGMHHQLKETAQSKLVTVIKGSIIDFLIDLRRNNFEETYFFRLNPGDQLYVPKGFAHGFLALEEDTMIQYLVDAPYSPSTEISFDWKSNETVKEIILAEIGECSNIKMSIKDSNGIKLTREHVETIDYDKL